MRKYFSWLECILIFAVLVMLIVLAVRYFTVVDLNTRVAQAISKIDIISRASHNWLLEKHEGRFSEFSMRALIQNQRLEEADALNPWGGTIRVSRASHPNHVRIELKAVPFSACQRLRRHLRAIAFVQATAKDCARHYYYGEY